MIKMVIIMLLTWYGSFVPSETLIQNSHHHTHKDHNGELFFSMSN